MKDRLGPRAWPALGGLLLASAALGCPDIVGRGRPVNVDPMAPTRPIITGPTTVTQGTRAFYNLTVTDPQGARVDLLTSTPECVIEGYLLTFSPAQAGAVTIKVTARNAYGLVSEPGQVAVSVQAP